MNSQPDERGCELSVQNCAFSFQPQEKPKQICQVKWLVKETVEGSCCISKRVVQVGEPCCLKRKSNVLLPRSSLLEHLDTGRCGGPVTPFAVLAGWVRKDVELLRVIKLGFPVICVKAQRCGQPACACHRTTPVVLGRARSRPSSGLVPGAVPDVRNTGGFCFAAEVGEYRGDSFVAYTFVSDTVDEL